MRWLPLAGVTTALCDLVYLTVRQTLRHLADDPQIRIARDAGASVGSGQPVECVVPKVQIDMGQSLAPFVMAFNDAGAVIASWGQLHGQPRGLPQGVLEHVRQRGEHQVTWQPEPGLRIASHR